MFLAISLMAPADAADDLALRIGYTNQESPLFIMGNGTKIPALPGIAVEIVASAAKTCAVVEDTARYPGGRLLALLGDNTLDAVLMLSFSPERLAIAAYPMTAGSADPAFELATLSYAFYVRSDSNVTWDGTTISGLDRPVGTNFGWSITNDLRERQFPVETAQDTTNNFNKLLLKRIDAFAIQTSIGDAYVAANNLKDRIKMLEPPITSKPYYLVFSHSWYDAHPDQADCIWREIAKIRDRDMAALLSRYYDSL